MRLKILLKERQNGNIRFKIPGGPPDKGIILLSQLKLSQKIIKGSLAGKHPDPVFLISLSVSVEVIRSAHVSQYHRCELAHDMRPLWVSLRCLLP